MTARDEPELVAGAGARPPSIVAGFDDTPSGYDAVALGRDLAEATGARLIVVHVYALPPVGPSELALSPHLGEALRDEAQERLDHARPALAGFDRWDAVVHVSAPPARGLHEIAERSGAELIVVGFTHRHGLGRVTPGSTADRLLHGSGIPVGLAPAGWQDEPPGGLRVVGAAFDGSEESEVALAAAASLARASGASLRAIAVFEPPQPANPIFAVTAHGYGEIVHDLRAALTRRVEDAIEALPAGSLARGEVLEGEPADVLARESHALDLLCIGSRGFGPLRAVMLGTLARELASRSACPLVIVPRGAQRPLQRLASRDSTARSGGPRR